jgi:hypothetical protein
MNNNISPKLVAAITAAVAAYLQKEQAVNSDMSKPAKNDSSK